MRTSRLFSATEEVGADPAVLQGLRKERSSTSTTCGRFRHLTVGDGAETKEMIGEQEEDL